MLGTKSLKSIKRLRLGSIQNKKGYQHPLPFERNALNRVLSMLNSAIYRFPLFFCINSHCNMLVRIFNHDFEIMPRDKPTAWVFKYKHHIFCKLLRFLAEKGVGFLNYQLLFQLVHLFWLKVQCI